MKLKDILSFSHSFCVLPFIHKHIDVHKNRKLCCISNETVDESRLLEIRQDMLENKPIPECINCMNVECNKVISERQTHNKRWFKADIIDNPQELFYDLRYSNLCNLRCQTCNSSSSSEWARFLGEDSIYNSWEPTAEINPNAERIYLAGGEPFLIKSFSKILNNIENVDCEVVVNTNATVITDHLINALRKFSNVCFVLSIDGIGKLNDQIRTGSSWNTIQENIEELKDELNPSFMINTVLQKDNMVDIPNIADWIDSNHITNWHVTVLRKPEIFHYKHFKGEYDWSTIWDRNCVKVNPQVASTLKSIINNT